MDARLSRRAAFGYVGLVTLYVYAWALFDWDLAGWLAVATVAILSFAVYLLTGFLVGRWWVVLVLFVPVLLSLPLGSNPQDSDRSSYWALVLIPTIFATPIVVLGLVARIIVNRWPPAQRFFSWTRREPAA